jgi:7,8-dihydro-6-hydroxymethylpterin dimethyltransferase
MPGMPLRGDRIHRYVAAFCPRCHDAEPFRPLDEVPRLAGYLAERDGRIWLERGCAVHGRVTTLYDEDPEILRYLEEWTAPTKQHTPDTAGNWDPVPSAYLRGLGEMQTQHTCILLEDVTASCNLTCPTCFAESAPGRAGMVPAERVLANIDQRLARENGRIDVLMLSGGEPTIHPEFERIVEGALDRDVVRLLVNSNGIRLAKDDALLRFFEKHNRRLEVYLQFDGFRLATHRAHRGADLRRVKEDVVRRLSDAGVFTTLTMTASLGVNDDEIGDVIRLALDTPFVGGVSIQPQFGSGRSGAIDPMNRLTHTGVLGRLANQTNGLVTWRDLTALPCSHPHCCSVGYMLRTDGGEWKSLVGIIGHDRLKTHLDLVANRINDPEMSAQLRGLLKEALLGLLSEQSSLSHPSVARIFRDVCESCDLGLSTLVRLAGDALLGNTSRFRRLVAERIKRITIKPFMDMSTMLEERLLQCCVHVGTQRGDTAAEHQCVPFCAVQAWPRLSATKLAELARREGEGLEGGSQRAAMAAEV